MKMLRWVQGLGRGHMEYLDLPTDRSSGRPWKAVWASGVLLSPLKALVALAV